MSHTLLMPLGAGLRLPETQRKENAMGIIDAFKEEDRVPVKFDNFYRMIKESTKAELLMNAVNCNVPHRYIREMATGKSEAPGGENDGNKNMAKNAR